jgi:hypothetical protein
LVCTDQSAALAESETARLVIAGGAQFWVEPVWLTRTAPPVVLTPSVTQYPVTAWNRVS